MESDVKTTAKKIKQENGAAFQRVFVRTVSHCLLELGYRSNKPTKKLIKQASEELPCEIRRKFKTWTKEQWMSVLWSDEATFTVTCKCNRRQSVSP